MESTPASLLLRLRRSDDAAAWRRFVELYTPLLYYWACRLGLNNEDSGDLVQDVLTTLVEKLPTFQYEPGKKFRAFLRTIIENRWRDLMRRRATRPAVMGAALDDVPAPEQSDFAEEEYRRLILERAGRVMRSDFQEATWRAFWATVVEGKSGAEAATELGMSLDAVYVARSRVLRRLRQELEGLLD